MRKGTNDLIIAAIDGIGCACNCIIISSFNDILLSIYGIILPIVDIVLTIPIRTWNSLIVAIIAQ